MYHFLGTTHGVLMKVDHVLYFVATDSGDILEVEPEHCASVMTLGAVSLHTTQRILDELRGGAAWIATHRPQEVA
jgi:hypothetical protein